MQEANWSDVMTLLAAMVAVDGKVFKEEVDAFVTETCTLRSLINTEIPFSKKQAYDWYVTHRAAVRKMCKAVDASDRILEHINSLSKNPNRALILASMNNIAISDSNLHASEHEILSLAAKTWGLKHPS